MLKMTRVFFKFFVAAVAVSCISNPARANASRAYSAVWQPGTGAERWKTGMSMNEFREQAQTYYDQGLRIKSLAVRDERFVAVWRPGDGAEWWSSGMTMNEFKEQAQTYYEQGLRISSLEIDNGRVTAVWHPGTGAEWWRSGMTMNEFKEQDKAYFDQGLRISLIEIENNRVTAVWHPGTGAQWWKSGMTGAQLEQQDQTYFEQDLRLTALAIKDGRYTAVWRPGSGRQRLRYQRCPVDFKTESTAYFSRGFRLALIELDDEGVGAYQYPWKSGDTYRIGQGNNNPTGTHNGSQVNAFDFTMPTGTQLLATRDGTVEWIEESLTANFDFSEPESPSNRPLNGLDNWGNAVRIRHADGFTSWYFHIQTNGVLVSEGDRVEQGQPIAISGNTGRSTRPHLHYQVQANSYNGGQSVPINFGNCERPESGSKVTSENRRLN